MSDTIKICDNHQYYKVPLIWTFAFPGAEYWCPYCGFAGGILGSGTDVKATKRMIDKKKKYKKLSTPYLRAIASGCASEMKWNGKWYKPKDLPETAKRFFRKAVDGWKYRQKV